MSHLLKLVGYSEGKPSTAGLRTTRISAASIPMRATFKRLLTAGLSTPFMANEKLATITGVESESALRKPNTSLRTEVIVYNRHSGVLLSYRDMVVIQDLLNATDLVKIYG